MLHSEGIGTQPRPPLISRVCTNREEVADELLSVVGRDPSWTQLREVFSYLRDDRSLDRRERDHLIRRVSDHCIAVMAKRRVPTDYAELKSEAQLLAEMTRQSFVLMAIRLRKIRDRKLYLEDGYPDFKSFLDGEILLSRSTVYNYIDIVTYFDVQPVGHEPDLEYSKLLPIIPLLKADDASIPKERIRSLFLDRARESSREELKRLADRYKARYGLKRDTSGVVDRVLARLRKQLPARLTGQDKIAVQETIRYLTRLVDS